MTTEIHPTAIIDPAAHIGEGSSIGPFCIIGANVKIGKNCKLHSHIVIDCHVTLGDDNQIFPFVSMMQPQDLKYKGEPTEIIIGNGNTFREHVTVNPGTVSGTGKTVIGNSNLLMIGVHIAHDCVVGNGNVFANNATLAGHVTIGNYTILGGLSAYHQFVKIGDYAIIGGMSAVESDVIPYGLVKGERSKLAGLNHIGLDRNGFSKEDIKSIMGAYKMLFSDNGETFKTRLEQTAEKYKGHDTVSAMIDFITSERKQPLCQPK
jgi:UDP-N-acetylglucosamine acyltransferase